MGDIIRHSNIHKTKIQEREEKKNSENTFE